MCQFKPTKKSLQNLSIFDGSSNFTGIAKLGIFIRCVFQNFDKFEHFLSLVPMQNIAAGKHILESIVAMYQLCVVVTFFKIRIMNLGYTSNIIKLPCVRYIRKHYMRGRQSIMNITVNVVNTILSNKLYHR